MLDVNPVVIRRTMAGLRDAGYVTSEKGHGGGWRLARPLGEMTLLDIYHAIGKPPVFAVGPACDTPECLVEQAVNAALTDAFVAAEKLLLERLGDVTLADIARDFEARFAMLRGHGAECKAG